MPPPGGQMRYLAWLTLIAGTNILPIQAQSTLLESVKSNQQEALALCKEFRALNKKGVSASSNIAISDISRKRNISQIDAEILSTYVIGLNCPDVR